MTLGGFNLTSFLDAMSQQQLTDVQAEPSVTTVDNKEATAVRRNEHRVPAHAADHSRTDPGDGAADSSSQDIGITLQRHAARDGEPAGADGRLRRSSRCCRRSPLRDRPTAKRNSTNQVLVGDGETAVISGLTQTQIVKNKTGIPILMNLPGIGKLFSQSDSQERKQDLLILVTPHIVDEGEVVGRGRQEAVRPDAPC